MLNVVKNGRMTEATRVTEMEVNGEVALVFALPLWEEAPREVLEEEVTVAGEMAEMEVVAVAERGITAVAVAVEEAEEEKMAKEEVEGESQVAMAVSPLKER